MKPKLLIGLALFLLLLLPLMPSAAALGIRPAKTTILAEETLAEGNPPITGQFWVVNDEQRQFTMDVSVDGELVPYVTLHTKELSFRPDDAALPVLFEIHLPSSVPPGTSTANIAVMEVLESSSPNTISSVIVLKHRLIVQGEYPDKYVEAALNFYDSGKDIQLVSEIRNLGKENIGRLYTTFYVNDRQQQAHTLTTEESTLKTQETARLQTALGKDLFEQGEFDVSAITTYDDQQIELTKTLLVGQPEVEITYFNPYFIAYTINQYSMDLWNRWNKELKNVYVDVTVQKDSQQIDAFRTRSVDIEGEMIKRITDYLNANDKGPGRYTFQMTVHFWNLVRMDDRQFTFESEFLTEKDAETIRDSSFSSVTGSAVAHGDDGKLSPWWAVAGIVSLLIILIIIGTLRHLRSRRADSLDSGF